MIGKISPTVHAEKRCSLIRRRFSLLLVGALITSLALTACDNGTTADTTAPAKVTDFNRTPGIAHVTLSWTDPADADLDHIEITVAPAVSGSPFTVAKGTGTIIITGLTEGTPYTFTARAVDANGNQSEAESTAATPAAEWTVSTLVELNAALAAIKRDKTLLSAGAVIVINGEITQTETIPEENATGTSLNMVYLEADAYPPLEFRGISGGTLNVNATVLGRNDYRVLYVGAHNQVTLGSDLTLKGGRASSGSGVYVATNGKFAMSDGAISGNAIGRGVYVATNGEFTMSGGIISGNGGGGVYVAANGEFTMSGGVISGNTITSSTSSGGGVYVLGKFTMSDGTISGNTATATATTAAAIYTDVYGGGVYVATNGEFTMNDGTISDNTVTAYYVSSAYGGGVYVAVNGKFAMSDGAISGNTGRYGGGVYVVVGGGSTTGKFTKSGGTIYGGNESGSDENGKPLKNNVFSVADGNAVYCFWSNGTVVRYYYRDTTLGAGHNINTTDFVTNWTLKP
jgi:hypothetical protein